MWFSSTLPPFGEILNRRKPPPPPELDGPGAAGPSFVGEVSLLLPAPFSAALLRPLKKSDTFSMMLLRRSRSFRLLDRLGLAPKQPVLGREAQVLVRFQPRPGARLLTQLVGGQRLGVRGRTTSRTGRDELRLHGRGTTATTTVAGNGSGRIADGLPRARLLDGPEHGHAAGVGAVLWLTAAHGRRSWRLRLLRHARREELIHGQQNALAYACCLPFARGRPRTAHDRAGARRCADVPDEQRVVAIPAAVEPLLRVQLLLGLQLVHHQIVDDVLLLHALQRQLLHLLLQTLHCLTGGTLEIARRHRPIGVRHRRHRARGAFIKLLHGAPPTSSARLSESRRTSFRSRLAIDTLRTGSEGAFLPSCFDELNEVTLPCPLLLPSPVTTRGIMLTSELWLLSRVTPTIVSASLSSVVVVLVVVVLPVIVGPIADVPVEEPASISRLSSSMSPGAGSAEPMRAGTVERVAPSVPATAPPSSLSAAEAARAASVKKIRALLDVVHPAGELLVDGLHHLQRHGSSARLHRRRIERPLRFHPRVHNLHVAAVAQHHPVGGRVRLDAALLLRARVHELDVLQGQIADDAVLCSARQLGERLRGTGPISIDQPLLLLLLLLLLW
uniref:Uncharacterized protein n=1 Tax=Anopheles atroparvus TaxID=41427 RepID=A0A182IKF9_ANOAO